MSKWFLWLGLTAVTGSPLLSLGLLVVAWFVLDRFTLGILPDPLRAVLRWRRIGQLRRTLAQNPHDRAARFELADLLVAQRRFGAAVPLLKANLEEGEDDAATLLLMGQACHGIGKHDQAELFLESAAEHQPDFRHGAIQLERGRGLLQKGDAAGAKAQLQAFVTARRSTVEGRVLLAGAHAKLGEATEAAKLRDEAWSEFTLAPRFQRRRERWWAWRARPSRPLLYLVIAAACGLLVSQVLVPAVQRNLAEASAWEEEPYSEGEEFPLPPE
jgi:tetratricopeptide (TPR) repeat protein